MRKEYTKKYGFADCDSRGDDGCAKCKADYWLAEVDHCCTLCTWGMDDVPDDWCDGCDSMDI